MGDAGKGKKIFTKMCGTCHTTEKGGKHKIGPNLFGVIGQTCGTAPGFAYSDAMKKKGITWSETTMDEYLQFPKRFVPGTKMVFMGIKKEDDRKNLIAYLVSLK
ncbi:cytochrome c-like [Orussus abietinus]|uniref:cytochrome c-like n=1 Tax=Orussus abietinus TaxID=222816 RepID=UPI00062691F4|nr:cytochrome c-like [Orussus abietinus]